MINNPHLLDYLFHYISSKVFELLPHVCSELLLPFFLLDISTFLLMFISFTDTSFWKKKS
jgi:hypothetical protein